VQPQKAGSPKSSDSRSDGDSQPGKALLSRFKIGLIAAGNGCDSRQKGLVEQSAWTACANSEAHQQPHLPILAQQHLAKSLGLRVIALREMPFSPARIIRQRQSETCQKRILC
jgi:hypothetical protein